MITPTPGVRITAKRDGFRRAGMAHPDKPVIHPPGTFTADQIKALMAEPMLLVDVAEVDIEDWDLAEEQAADAKTPAKGGKAGGKAETKNPEPPKGGDGQ